MSGCALPACAGLVLALVVGCSGPDGAGPDARRHVPVPDSVMTEVAVQCLDLLEEYRHTDFEAATEDELQRQMDESMLNEELCSEALGSAYDGPGGAMMGTHLAREMSLHALNAELTLSERFDEMGGYCAILGEVIGLLTEDLRGLADLIEGHVRGERGLSDADLQALVSLRDLSLQTLQVSLVDYRTTCAE